jgi:hypothetical protein
MAVFDHDGNNLWSKQFAGANLRAVSAIGSEKVVVAGGCDAGTDFGGGPLASRGACVAELDSAGDHVWSRHVGDLNLMDLAADASGNVVLAGYPGDLDTDPGRTDVYVAKLDASGNALWTKTFGDDEVQVATNVAVDGSGEILVAGTFFGGLDFGGGPLLSAGGEGYNYESESDLKWGGDIFLAKLDGAGDLVWNRRFGDRRAQAPRGIVTAADGSIALTGGVVGVVDFGIGPQTGVSWWGDVFAAKFDAAGDTLWSGVYSGGFQQIGRAVAIAPSGQVIVAGTFSDAIDFGFGVHELQTKDYDLASDIFLAKLAAP